MFAGIRIQFVDGKKININKLRIDCYDDYFNRGFGVTNDWIWVSADEVLD